MITLQSIFANGWIQIAILLAIFYGFTRWAIRNGAKSGYAIGWLIGIFLVVTYSALFPRSAVQLAAADTLQLELVTVLISSCSGGLVGLIIVGITLALREAWFRQIFSTAGITAVLVTMLFIMIMSPTPAKMALSLASLAFSIVIAIAYVVRRAYIQRYTDLGDDELIEEPNGYERLDRIREQATTTNRL